MRKSYRSQHRVHKLINIASLHQVCCFEYANCKLGDDGGMLLERLLEDFAILVIAFEGADLWDAAEAFKRPQIQFIDMGDVGVSHYGIGEGLNVAQSMGYATARVQYAVLEIREEPLTASAAPACSNWPSRSDETRSTSFRKRSTVAS
jgi:hypothetical protein